MAQPAIPSAAEIAAVCEAALRGSLDPNGTGAVNLQPGSDNAAYVSVCTQLGKRLFAYVADRVAARSKRTGKGSDLDDVARDVYGTERKDEAYATGTVYLQRATALTATSIYRGARFGVPQQGTQQALQFESTADVSAGVGVTAVAVPVQCRSPGTVGNVQQSAITAILDQLSDPTWQVYQPAPGDPVLGGGAVDVVAGGDDAEDDETLQARLDGRSIAVDEQRGVKDAIVNAALEVPGVRYATAVEPGDGTVLLYVGDPSFQVSSALRLAVLLKLEGYRADGNPVFVRPYDAILEQVSLRLYMAQPLVNYDRPALLAAAQKAVVRYFATLVRPDEFYRDGISGFVRKDVNASAGEGQVQLVIVDAPAADMPRPADAGYGSVLALKRYYATLSSVSITLLDPKTS